MFRCSSLNLRPLKGALLILFIMKNSSKLTKGDLKWIKFNQKMAQMSGKKKTSKDFLDALKNAHDEVFND
jgi:hypothetical protein